MGFKNEIKHFIFYNLIIGLFIFFAYKLELINELYRYMMYKTETFKFQELLSIGITIFIVFLGAIITVATVLISMCDKRIIKLISKYNKSKYLIKAIKTSIITGIIAIIILAGVYAKLDFNIVCIRISLLYISGYLTVIFINKSRVLIITILSILNESFTDEESIVIKSKFINSNDKE